MWYIIGLIVAISIFVTGFLVGHKWGARVFKAKDTLKDTLGKM